MCFLFAVSRIINFSPFSSQFIKAKNNNSIESQKGSILLIKLSNFIKYEILKRNYEKRIYCITQLILWMGLNFLVTNSTYL